MLQVNRKWLLEELQQVVQMEGYKRINWVISTTIWGILKIEMLFQIVIIMNMLMKENNNKIHLIMIIKLKFLKIIKI